MTAHVTLHREAQAPLIRAVVEATAKLSTKDLKGLSKAALRVVVEELLERMAPSDDPLAKARLRGLVAQREALDAEGGTFSAKEMAEALGITRQAVDKRRRKKQLLAVEVPKRGYLYPRWQVADPSRADALRQGTLPGLSLVLAELPDDSPWAKLRFFLSGNARLRGRRPLDLLRKGDVESVLRAARAFGEHGAA